MFKIINLNNHKPIRTYRLKNENKFTCRTFSGNGPTWVNNLCMSPSWYRKCNVKFGQTHLGVFKRKD